MTEDHSNTTVLVTGASGFIALHCVLQLLEAGYRVRGTVRKQSREAEIRATMQKHVDADDRLEIVEADLTSDDGWADAVRGCTYVLHVASPFPSAEPKDENDLIRPAVDGTLRVLKAAADAGVKRVVQTSSLAAVSYGQDRGDDYVFTESDWSDPALCAPYPKSKTIAEQSAWDFVKGLPDDIQMELVVINPGAVLGPLLDTHYSTSGEIVRKLLKREIPGTAKIGFPMVDVRDVAGAHILAMTTPDAAGKRFCCALEHAWLGDVAEILNKHFTAQGYKVPTRNLPKFVVRVVSLFDPTIRQFVNDIGRKREVSNKQIFDVLKWEPHSVEDMVVSMGTTMIEQGVV